MNPRLNGQFERPKLWQLSNMIYSCTGVPSLIYVVDDEEFADKLAEVYPDLDKLEYTDAILATIQSSFQMCVTMNDSFCDKTVEAIYAAGRNTFVVWVT